MVKITPLILAGGSGNRLWPLSTQENPKQFSIKIEGRSLFSHCLERITTSSIVNFETPIISTNFQFENLVLSALKDISMRYQNLILEPEKKNTAASVISATLIAFEKNPNTVILVTPSDQIIPNITSLHEAIAIGLKEIKSGNLVTFGIAPTSPETRYGYLEISKGPLGRSTKLKGFIEKPALELAQNMFKTGKFMWNSGLFLFRASDMITEFEKYEPELTDQVRSALGEINKNRNIVTPNEIYWKKLKKISIDKAIMEKAQNLYVVPYLSSWSDLGSWDSVWKNLPQSEKGVVVTKNTTEYDCKNSMLYSERGSPKIVGIGLDNIFAVSTRNVTLVASMSNAPQVGGVLEALKVNSLFNNINTDSNSIQTKEVETEQIQLPPKSNIKLKNNTKFLSHIVIVKGQIRIESESKSKNLKLGESETITKNTVYSISNNTNGLAIFLKIINKHTQKMNK
jgi:mannose-1-phosphate guanylyltransferase / mannose-6-phosphate isomerase